MYTPAKEGKESVNKNKEASPRKAYVGYVYSTYQSRPGRSGVSHKSWEVMPRAGGGLLRFLDK
jgi:hypothetical protein